MQSFVNHGLGQMQCKVAPSNDSLRIKPSKMSNEESGMRLDSGICVSGASRVNSIDSVGPITNSLSSDVSIHACMSEDTRLESVDSGLGSMDEERTSSLHQQLLKLKIDEPLKEEPVRPYVGIPLHQLQARTKEQKLRDLASYDFNSSEEIPAKPKSPSEDRCDSGRCSSLTEEEERPPHFEQDHDGDTFLHLMIVHDEVSVASQVIDRCPSWPLLNIQNELGQTALHLSVLTNHADVARKLLVHGAALDLRDRHGNTALHLACKQGSLDCVLALTRRVKHKETLPVGYAVSFQRIPQRAELQNYDGHTCLQLAANGSHYDIMRHLVIECRADINEADWKSGRTLLHIAAEKNDTTLAEFLLSHPRINTEARTYEGHTPLRLAVGRQHMDIVQLLMLAGANTDDDDDDSARGSSGEEEENMNCNSDSDFEDFDDMEFQGQSVFPR